MFNPIEMFQAQGGAGMQAMAQQFGLSPEQTARALEALMPALTLGIQRGAGLDPTGFARMFGMPDLARSAAPQGLDALGQMFGSAQLMQAVLQQASNASGVGSQVLRQMLPMMAGAVVASIVHVMLNQPTPEPARQPAASPPSQLPFGAIWADMAKAFMPVSVPAAAKSAPTASKPAPTRTPPQAKPLPPPAPEPKSGADGPDVFQQMFRTGAEMQGQNMKAMQELFESFWPTTVKAAAVSEPPATPPPEPAPATPPEPIPPRPAPKARRGRTSED